MSKQTKEAQELVRLEAEGDRWWKVLEESHDRLVKIADRCGPLDKTDANLMLMASILVCGEISLRKRRRRFEEKAVA